MRTLNRETMETIRDKFLPRHFKENADTRPGGGYGYQARSMKYRRRKRRLKGHNIPLVYSGRLRTAILAGVTIGATARSAHLRTRGYFKMREQMRAEIEVVSSKERKRLAERFGKRYVELANSKQFRRQRRKKTGGGA